MNSSTEITRRTTCRICDSSDLTHLFTLGNQHVSDFVPEDKVNSGIKCPISLQLCNHCTLVQQEYTAPQDFLYTRHYWYKSGTTETMRNALQDVVDAAIKQVKLNEGDVVLDLGSNDATLLHCYSDSLLRVGVEPANNFNEDYGEPGENVPQLINDFWSEDAYRKAMLRHSCVKLKCTKDGVHGQAKIITACGMFYDLEEPSKFIADVAKVLHPEGVFVAQLMCLKQTIEQGDVGNFAHEHLEFYSLKSLATLFEKHGLRIHKIEENTVNGGSYRIYAKHAANYPHQDRDVRGWFVKEWEMGLHEANTYSYFAQRIEENKKKLVDFLKQAVADDKVTWIYGASTKGNVLLQYWGIDNKLCEFACDKSIEKWDKYTCTGIQIGSEEIMRRAEPDYLLVLPYSFINEFCVREKEFLMRGGKFIVPLPEPYTIEADEVDVAAEFMWYPKDRMPLLKVRKL